MPFDSLSLAAITREISDTLVGDRIQSIHQPESLTLILTFSRKRRLLISAHPDFARAYFCSHALPHPAQPPAFCMLLRKHLEGARLKSAQQSRFDRILELEFIRSEGAMTLVAELMGRHSNIMLRGADGVLRGVIKPVPVSVNRFRELAAGRDYIPPPSGGKANPLDATAEERAAEVIERSGDGGAGRAIAGAWTGMSPTLVTWLLERAGISPEDPQPPEAGLVRALWDLREIVANGRFEPSLGPDKAGRSDFWALPMPGQPVTANPERVSMSRLVEQFFDQMLAAKELEDLRRDALAGIKQAIQRERRKLDDFDRVVEEASRVDEFRRWAEALMAYPGLVLPGAAEASLPDPSGDESVIVVPLDPELDAVEIAERYFHKARDAQRSAQQVAERAVESRMALQFLEGQRERVQTAKDVEDVRRLIATGPVPRVGGAPPVSPAETGKKKRSAETVLPSGVRRVQGPGGYEILYGRSSSDNDYLTTRIARPNDIWLHVRGETSAHVVIRTNNQPGRVPRETLLEAANVAAIHSASKHSGYVSVDYTLRKYVVKRRGSPPGTVEYRGEKTLQVQPRLG
ncbi:MAG TPA: NFACT family protein [Armatimonadota bacterium]|nr:NFACT family protein [Armatimonadota bacterium]